MRAKVRVCSEPGCGELTTRGGPCPACRRLAWREQDCHRPNSSRRGYGARWQRTRARFLAAHPVCEHEDGCDARAVDVHHRDGLGPLGPRGHDPDNLQAMCHSHHSAVTAREVFAR